IIAKYHHEMWDGSGYPCGLKGLEIPLPARLMALADVFDALTTARPYKNAWSMEETAEYIIGLRGIQFDPEIVDAFVKEIDTLSDILKSLTEE
ncbi:MAG: two-component system response regulator, partial [Clostridiales bacterium]|nr:two-component system response regulator [Clostridiales bacterium]